MASLDLSFDREQKGWREQESEEQTNPIQNIQVVLEKAWALVGNMA